MDFDTPHDKAIDPQAKRKSDEASPDQERDPQADTPETTSDEAKPEGNDEKDAPKPTIRDRLRQHPVLAVVALCVVLVAIVGGVLYWLNARQYESTDDAFVDARSFSVAPKVGGYITDVLVTDNQHVDAGTVIAQIDKRDYQIAVEQMTAQVESAKANIDNVDAQIASQQSQIDQARDQVEQAVAQQKFSQQEYDRAQDLVAKGAGTVQRAQQTKSDLDAQDANLSRAKSGQIAAERQIKVLETQRQSAQASLAQAQAQLDQAKLNLAYTSVTAAQAGRVAKLGAAKGGFVNSGQSLMMFVPDDIWVTANYKETQLTYMRPGQPVDIRIDAYPDHKLTGKIASVQPGSGTVFSLLPAENATGNYVKVVQRVPVKITVDRWPDDVPIGPGMSVVPRTKVR